MQESPSINNTLSSMANLIVFHAGVLYSWPGKRHRGHTEWHHVWVCLLVCVVCVCFVCLYVCCLFCVRVWWQGFLMCFLWDNLRKMSRNLCLIIACQCPSPLRWICQTGAETWKPTVPKKPPAPNNSQHHLKLSGHANTQTHTHTYDPLRANDKSL